MTYHSAVFSFSFGQLVKYFSLNNVHSFDGFEIMPIKVSSHGAICLLPLAKCPTYVALYWGYRVICLLDVVFEKLLDLDPHFPLVHYLE